MWMRVSPTCFASPVDGDVQATPSASGRSYCEI